QVEYVTRIGFAAGRALEHERDLAVGSGVFGKVVVNDQRIHAVLHEPFTHGATGKGSEVKVGSVFSGRSYDDDGVFHCAGLFEGGDGAGNRRVLLADGYVNAVNGTEIFFAGGSCLTVDVGLIDDRVDGDGRLAGTAVTDDQLALAAA